MVTGHVFASELVPGSDTGTNSVNRPLELVRITVDGAEEDRGTQPKIEAFTDATGFFALTNCPAGRFFVHVDGRTVTNLAAGIRYPDLSYYPFVGKAWEALAGYTNLAGDGPHNKRTGNIYLPLIVAGTLQSVSATVDTTITFPPSVIANNPALAGVSITVPANSLYGENGTRGGEVGIAPVPPDRLPGPLPPGMNPPIVITVQTSGSQNFDRPAPIQFPNLEKLPPGEKTPIFSFDHDTGRWEVVGTATVSEDGLMVKSDPGMGILAPGWHFVQVGTPTKGEPCQPSLCVVIGGNPSDPKYLGDVIKIDLNLALPKDSKGILARAKNWRLTRITRLKFATLEGGVTLLGSETGNRPFSETGVLFFIPEITEPSKSESELGDGPVLNETTFNATLIDSSGNESTPDDGLLQIKVEKGYRDAIPLDTTHRLNVYKIQQRLRYLGYQAPSGNGASWLGADGDTGPKTEHAIGVFNAAIASTTDFDANATPASTVNGTINDQHAPRWLKIPAGGVGWAETDEADDHNGATSWTVTVIGQAGQGNAQNPITPPIRINDASQKGGGHTQDHSTHQAGMDADVRISAQGSAGP